MAIDPAFSSAIANWQNFYMLSGSASASLVGLLFVAVSLHLQKITAEDATHLLSFANHTFSGFLYVLLVSLFILIPGQTSQELGVELVLLGFLTTVRQWRYLREIRAMSEKQRHIVTEGQNPLYKSTVPMFCCVGMGAIGVALLQTGSARALSGLVSIVLVTLLSGARNAWRLLIQLARI